MGTFKVRSDIGKVYIPELGMLRAGETVMGESYRKYEGKYLIEIPEEAESLEVGSVIETLEKSKSREIPLECREYSDEIVESKTRRGRRKKVS